MMNNNIEKLMSNFKCLLHQRRDVIQVDVIINICAIYIIDVTIDVSGGCRQTFLSLCYP